MAHVSGGTSGQVQVKEVALLGLAATFLYAVLFTGLCVIQPTQRNLGATRLVMQKAEALKLFTASQIPGRNDRVQPIFVEQCGFGILAGIGGGAQYTGYLTAAAPAAGDSPEAQRSHMRDVKLTVCWTNYSGIKPAAHKREMQVRLARNGMPKYIWGAF